VRGVDADRVEEDVLAHARAEQALQLREPRGLERAFVGAARVDDVERDRFALQQVVVEAHRLAVLVTSGTFGE
jgi:hypothetical protein